MPYLSLPPEVRARWESRMGSRVVSARTHPGGFSPGVAASLRLANGERLFLKAVSSEANSDSVKIYRREALVAAALPAATPAPRFRWMDEFGPWVAIAFEEAPGENPPLPWRKADLARVVDSLTEMSRALTPSPLALPSLARTHRDSFTNWRTVPRGSAGIGFTSSFGPWAQSHREELRRAEARLGQATRGRTLLHFDVRADNVVLTPRRVYFVDWPHACVGPVWADLAALLPSVAMQGGPPPWEIFDRHPLAKRVPAEDVDAFVAALTGLFLFRGRRPVVRNLPNLREFQWAQGRQSLRWLRYRWEGTDVPDAGLPSRPIESKARGR